MKCKVLFLSACAGILVASSIASSDQSGDSAMDKHHCAMMGDLKLSADQQTKIQALHKDMMESGKALLDQMKGINEKVKAELLKDQPSKQALDGLAAQLAEIQKQLLQKHFDHMLQVKTVLTKEQFSKHVGQECVCMPGAAMCGGMGEGCRGQGMCNKAGEGKGGHGKAMCGGKGEEGHGK